MALTPFQEGVFAAKTNAGAANNPYAVGTAEFATWSKGYEAVQAAVRTCLDIECDEPDPSQC